MRRAVLPKDKESIMRCLGGLHGAGILTCGDKTVARAEYDFDGFLSKVGQMTACGEIWHHYGELENAY